MRYCGSCGESFDPADLAERTCPNCGAAINRTGDLAFDDVWDSARNPTQAPQSTPDADSFSASPTAPAYGFGIRDPQSLTIATQNGRSIRPIALLALVAMALLLVFGSALLLNYAAGRVLQSVGGTGADVAQATATYSATSPGAQSSPTNSSLSGGAQPSPGATLTAGLPSPSASPNETPTPEGAPTATPAAGQPALSVSPTTITIAVCLGSTTRFTVTNTGDGVMTWSGTGSRAAYKISPQSGSLDNGQQQTVTVSGISASGSITIAAPGADGAPQTVTITCKL